MKPSFDRTKTLTELEADDWGEPEFDSSLVIRCHKLRYKPLKDFGVEDLRLLIGQNVSLDYLMPIAIEYLKEDLFAEGMYYQGDLLKNILSVEVRFWLKNEELKQEMDQLLINVHHWPKELEQVVQKYKSTWNK